MTLTEVINDEIKNPTVKYVALSKFSHAEEVSIDMPTTIVSACKDIEIAKIVQSFSQVLLCEFILIRISKELRFAEQ